MQAVTWHGKEDVRVERVPDPRIEMPTDAVIRVTSTAICGSDLHLYRVLGMFMEAGDILGHEPMGIVEEVGSAVTHIKPGDRVVVPFNISCGSCFMCDQLLYSQCETTQVTEHGKGASLFGYTKLYGHVPGGQAEYLRVPQAQFGPIKVPTGPADERFLYLSDILPTAWQALAYADVPKGGSVAVFGLGPVGQFCARIARHQGAEEVFGVDLVPERLEMAARHGVTPVDLRTGDVVEALRAATAGRGPLAQKAGVDRLAALYSAISAVRRGGTVSISGVYGGAMDPMPMLEMFDKQIQIRMGQANVRRWTDDIIPLLLEDADPLGTADLATHRLPLASAPEAYAMFQKKQDGCVKVVLEP